MNTKPKFWHSSLAFRKEFSFGGWRVVAEMRNNDGCMGRLGGGWAWKLGILASDSSYVLELFVMSIRIWLPKK